LKERWEAQQARASFFQAMQAFQNACPRIEKTKHVRFPSKQGGFVDYWYAPLPDIVQQIKAPLKDCGLSYRWEFQDEEGLITATCVLTHAQGHSEKTSMTGPADDSGGKNKIQQRGSTMQYLQRYTLIGVLGISTADSDMDGRLPQVDVETITEEQAADLTALMDETIQNKDKFLKWLKVEKVEDLPAKDFDRAVKQCEKQRKQ